MCPICVANALGMVAAGTVSTGGLAALAVKITRKKKQVEENIPEPDQRREEYGNQNSR